MGHNDLGDFHYDRGDLQSALKCYVRTRDYCTTSKHNISMCLNVIKVSIEMGNFAHVVNYVNKAEQEPEVRDASCDPVVVAKLKVCAGLAHLDTRKYKLAARKFLETTFDLGNHFNEVRLRCSRCRLCLKLECLTCVRFAMACRSSRLRTWPSSVVFARWPCLIVPSLRARFDAR
jgi:hypothetical protein